MKKLISFSMFLTLILVVLLVKTSQAQVIVMKARVGAPTMNCVSVRGYWKWNPRVKRYVWVEYRRAYRPSFRGSIRTHVIS